MGIDSCLPTATMKQKYQWRLFIFIPNLFQNIRDKDFKQSSMVETMNSWLLQQKFTQASRCCPYLNYYILQVETENSCLTKRTTHLLGAS